MASGALAAPPLSVELEGPPPPAPRFPPPAAGAVHGVLPSGWFLDSSGDLASPADLGALYEGATGGADLGGLACDVKSTSLPLAFAAGSVSGLTWAPSNGDRFFAPLPPGGPPVRTVKAKVYKSNTADKDPLQETVLAVVTVGLSLLRLTPDYVATLTVTTRGPGPWKATLGGLTLECRGVARADVERAAAPLLPKLAACASLDCLRPAAALLGPWDERVKALAQGVVDAGAREAAEARRRATTDLRTMTVLDARLGCGGRCALLTLRNDSAAPRALPTSLRALDAAGRELEAREDGFAQPIRPGATATRRLQLDPPGGTQVLGPVALFVEDRTAVIPVPGAGRVADVLLSLGPPRCAVVEGAPVVTLPVGFERFGPGSPGSLRAVFADGEDAWVSAWRLFDVPPLQPSHAEVTAKPDRKTCALPTAVTVEGDEHTAVLLVR